MRDVRAERWMQYYVRGALDRKASRASAQKHIVRFKPRKSDFIFHPTHAHDISRAPNKTD
jgi:hypothetical protein